MKILKVINFYLWTHEYFPSQYANASCKRFYRRRTLESCFHHPSKMIYPPGECYTPSSSPEPLELERTHVKPSHFDDYIVRKI
ncbi:UNVERIFIED_CONTAM: Unc-89 [Trichonephila clavipes]